MPRCAEDGKQHACVLSACLYFVSSLFSWTDMVCLITWQVDSTKASQDFTH